MEASPRAAGPTPPTQPLRPTGDATQIACMHAPRLNSGKKVDVSGIAKAPK